MVFQSGVGTSQLVAKKTGQMAGFRSAYELELAEEVGDGIALFG